MLVFHGWHALTLTAAAMGADIPLSRPLVMPARGGGSICLYLEAPVLFDLFQTYRDLREDKVYASLREKIVLALSGQGDPLGVISREHSPGEFPAPENTIALDVEVS